MFSLPLTTSPRTSHLGYRASVFCAILPSILIWISHYTRESGSSSWYDKGWSPSTNKHQTSKSSYSGWSRRGPRGNPAEDAGRHSHWDEGRAQDSANDTDGGAMDGQDKNRGGDVGTEEGGETVPGSKVSAPEPVNATDSEATEKKLWELQRLLNNRKGTLLYVFKRTPKQVPRPVTSTRTLCRHWTPWRRNT